MGVNTHMDRFFKDVDGTNRVIWTMLCVQRHSYRCMIWNWKRWNEQNTKQGARKTQMDRQAEKKTHTHDIDSWRQANREGWCVRETEAIIVTKFVLGGRNFTSRIRCLHRMSSVMWSPLWEEYLGKSCEIKPYYWEGQVAHPSTRMWSKDCFYYCS